MTVNTLDFECKDSSPKKIIFILVLMLTLGSLVAHKLSSIYAFLLFYRKQTINVVA